jgi:hypothetical protein
MEFLGFEINTRTMMVRWPIAKRLALKSLIEEHWLRLPCRRLPREVAQLLGTIRNAAYVAPLGNHLSIRLQQCLNDAVAHSGLRVSKRWWWFSAGVDIPAEVLEDVATIYHSLDDNDEHPVWQSYLGFLLAETINQRRKWQQPKRQDGALHDAHVLRPSA